MAVVWIMLVTVSIAYLQFLAIMLVTVSIDYLQTVQQLKDHIAQLTFPQRPSTKEPSVRKATSLKFRSTAYKPHQQQLQEQLQQQPQQQSQQLSPTQQPPRKWSDVNCCVLLQKPIEKILIRYVFLAV
jgi:hypothetical protein